MKVVMDLSLIKNYWGFFLCHLIQQKLKIYIALVTHVSLTRTKCRSFSGYACAHKIGSKLNLNSFELPE